MKWEVGFTITTSFLLGCRRNCSKNNRIMENTDKKLILAVFSYRCSSKAVAAVTLLYVVDPLVFQTAWCLWALCCTIVQGFDGPFQDSWYWLVIDVKPFNSWFPFHIEMLQDFLGLISTQALLMFSWSLFDRCLVHAFVVVSVVMSSIYALIGGSHSPFLSHSPPTTHPDAQTSSTTMVNASGRRYSPFYALRDAAMGWCCPELFSRTGGPGSTVWPALCFLWDLQEVKSCPHRISLGNWPKDIWEIEHHVKIFLWFGSGFRHPEKPRISVFCTIV